MAAYVIAEVEVTDPARYEDYKRLAPAAIAAHGGKYLVRGGASELLEGDRQPGRTVILEFPSLDHARRFYDSAQYGEAKRARAGAARFNLLLVEGL
jgi:uncharacterized protein (DUF1330 family)